MYDEIIEIAENRAYLQAVKDGRGHGPNLELINTLPSYSDLADFEKELELDNAISFNAVFSEPLGYYHIKLFLIYDYCVDKAILLHDISFYKMLKDPKARVAVGKLILERFLSPNWHLKFMPGSSVFDRNAGRIQEPNPVGQKSLSDGSRKKDEDKGIAIKLKGMDTNPVGIFGRPLADIKSTLKDSQPESDLFSSIEHEVRNDLKLDVFPKFLKSEFYKRYMRCKSLERKNTTIGDFDVLRVLGRGAFGFVKACIKRDSGKLYAMKCIDKRRVMATDSLNTIMYERDFLSVMDSNFVVCLKYAVMDENSLFLVLDLCIGGDLKFHLNKDGRFTVERSRFYAAEVLLGLEHIHSKGIIYRDMKLENCLLDERGHCKISDLGLAVKARKEKVKGYAGTPGYTAPEVVTNKFYDHMADFFSYGVMVYRFLSGKKPFAKPGDPKRGRRGDPRNDKRRKKERRKRGRQKSDQDKNVVEMKEEYPEKYFSPESVEFLSALMRKNPKDRLGKNGIMEIKNCAWFDPIDFGLLEAGYLDPPFVPNQDEIQKVGRNQDDKYKKQRLTEAFQKTLHKFPFQSVKALQEEVVEVLLRVDEGKNFERFAGIKSKETPSDYVTRASDHPSCCTIL